MFFFILITYLVDIVLILWGEILSWSLMGVKGLKSLGPLRKIPEHYDTALYKKKIKTILNIFTQISETYVKTVTANYTLYSMDFLILSFSVFGLNSAGVFT